MTFLVATTNVLLGLVYTSYGVMTIIDLKRGWRASGFSHFGLAWIAMAFTCGPHHLDHGLHVFAEGYGGPMDLFVVLVGLPAGVAWFLLRVEATLGGRGDRFIGGTPAWISALPGISVGYVVVVALAIGSLLRDGGEFGPRYIPNLLLLLLYSLIGYYLLRTQLQNQPQLDGWSVSGLALTIVMPTCGVMHAVQATYAIAGDYAVDWHGLAIDWLAVPAAVYFVWVVRGLQLGVRRDWNDGARGAQLAAA